MLATALHLACMLRDCCTRHLQRSVQVCALTLEFESYLEMERMGLHRAGGPGGSALAIQISQAGWMDAINLSIYLYDSHRVQVDSSWVLAPLDAKPKGVVHFLGGAFVGTLSQAYHAGAFVGELP